MKSTFGTIWSGQFASQRIISIDLTYYQVHSTLEVIEPDSRQLSLSRKITFFILFYYQHWHKQQHRQTDPCTSFAQSHAKTLISSTGYLTRQASFTPDGAHIHFLVTQKSQH